MAETRSRLLVRLRDRSDEAAWEAFNTLYRPMLVGYARARGLGQADAEDLAQQSIQAVVDQIAAYQHHGSFRAWLRTIAGRRIVDLRRGRREVQAGSGVWSRQRAEGEDPAALWDRHWWAAHLRRCAETVRLELAERTYAAFVGYAIEGRPPAAVAAQLGLTINQVYVAKHRVLRRIRSELLELTGEDGPGEV